MKIFTNGVRNRKLERDYEGRFTSFKRRVLWFVKRVIIGVVVVFTLAGIYVAGGYGNPVVKAELIKEGLPPVLARIAKCESHNSQFKDGQVLLNANKNDTVDIGKYQINNAVWSKTATKMGYDLMDEQGNEDFAVYLYKEKGTSPWSATYNCWR